MNAALHTACLLFGSNIEPEMNIPRAVELIQGQVAILNVSSVWESASAFCCYPDFLNMAAAISTKLDADELKGQVLRPLESQLGRVRTADKNASRTIDIDIVLFDGKAVDPDLWQYVHRAAPVAELFPDLLSERGERLKDVALRLAETTPIQIRWDISISPT